MLTDIIEDGMKDDGTRLEAHILTKLHYNRFKNTVHYVIHNIKKKCHCCMSGYS